MLHYLTDHYIDQRGARSESVGFGFGGTRTPQKKLYLAESELKSWIRYIPNWNMHNGGIIINYSE